MKTIYVLAAVAGLAFASCKDDAAEIRPAAYGSVENPMVEDKDPILGGPEDLMTSGYWTVDTFRIQVVWPSQPIQDTAYVAYGTLRFLRADAGRSGRAGQDPSTALHQHPNWEGQIVTDTLRYYFGDYNAGTASPNLLTLWRASGPHQNQRPVFRLIGETKRMRKYEATESVRNDRGTPGRVVRTLVMSKGTL